MKLSRATLPGLRMARQGILFVLSGASGVGKGTILKLALAQVSGLKFSVSWTTRAKRKGEVNGKDYFFKSREEFLSELNNKRGGFVEYAEFVGNIYGTPRRWIVEQLKAGHDVILDIELDGAMQVKKTMPEAVLVMMIPPNLSELRQRLLRRATETPEKIRNRLARAMTDMQKYKRFHYIITNEQRYTALDDLLAIIRSERLKTERIEDKGFKRHWSKNKELELVLDDIERTMENRGH